MRRDRPAARTTAVTRGSRGASSAIASARGRGRVGTSVSRPPGPISMISRGPTGRSAESRCSTQSKPLSFGERAQPGNPTTGAPSHSPIRMRLPGSTGMPKCTTRPPASSIPAGTTSRRSTMAEAPAIRKMSARAARASARRSATSASSWPQRRSATISPPSASTRARVISAVLSKILSFIPGSTVWTRATRFGRKGATRSSAPASAAIAAQAATRARGTAKGMILMVATICLRATIA